MTASEYYTSKNVSLGLGLTESQLEAFMLANFIEPSVEVNPGNVVDMDIAYLGIVLMILVKPDISEDGFSIKFDRKSVLKWYAYECNRLGVDNEVEASNFDVQDKSYLA